MPLLLRNITYDVFGPISLDYAAGEFFCWHFYARRIGRILIMSVHAVRGPRRIKTALRAMKENPSEKRRTVSTKKTA